MSRNVGYRAVVLAAGLVVAALLAEQLLTLVLVVTVMIIFSLPLASAASWGERRGLPRAAGALGALAVLAGALAGLGFLVIPPFISQATEFVNRLPAIVSDAARYIHGTTGVHAEALSTHLRSTVHSYAANPQRLLGPATQLGLSAVVVLVGLVLIVLAAFLVAVRPDPLLDGAMRLLPASRRGRALVALGRVRAAWLGWLAAIGIDMLVLGGLLFLGMELVGLPFALGFAVFSALMTIIPNFGSIISAVPPILAGLAQSPGEALLVLAVYVIVNQIEGNLILPLVMARTVDLHPAVVSMGLLVMGALFGVIGVLIAVPLVSLAIILVQTLWVEPQEGTVSLQNAGSG